MIRPHKKIVVSIFLILVVDITIGFFIFKSRSFPRLAIWNITETDDTSHFYWHPQDAPAGFYFDSYNQKFETFKAEISGLTKDIHSDLEKCLIVASYVRGISGKRLYNQERISWDSPQGMLEQLKQGKYGSCFNETIVFSAFLTSIGITSRLWALEGDDELGRFGHTVAEVFIKDLNKWVMIDVSKNIIFKKRSIPLSVLELRKEFINGNAQKLIIEGKLNPRISKEYVINKYNRLLKMVFLRSANDYVNKYNPKIRYQKLYKLEGLFDKLPSLVRRGLSYYLGRKEYLFHYVDKFNRPIKNKIMTAKFFFYLFTLSLAFTICLPLILVVKLISGLWQNSRN